MEQKTESQKRTDGCQKCGSDQVMLTEEKNAQPRCAGCGKPIQQKKSS